MYLRRWWGQHALKIGMVGTLLCFAWGVRQTNASLFLELYGILSLPFQGNPEQAYSLETAQSQEFQQRIIELESENRRLKSLLDYREAAPREGIVAPVIGRSSDHWWQQITVAKGSLHGVAEGDVVSGTGGLVGRIVQVTPNTSRVLLISDPASQVGVTISRSRSMGYIRGQSENRVVMEFFDKVPDVQPGDAVSTSSLSQLFPPGVPVGIIESVNLNRSPAPEAVVELTAPIGRLEWVIIAPNNRLELQDEAAELDELDPDTLPSTSSPTSP
jgi:rod shape-determining protein MreC